MASSVGLEPVEVTTAPSCYIEDSIRNVVAEMKLRHGFSPMPPCAGRVSSLPGRLARKAFRLVVVYPFRNLTVAAGAGADLHAVFRKPT